MSGDTEHYTEEDLLRLGVAAVFQKPFRLGELLQQLRQLAAPIGSHAELQGDRWEDDGGEGPTPPAGCRRAAITSIAPQPQQVVHKEEP
jgi:hypothetical protein